MQTVSAGPTKTPIAPAKEEPLTLPRRTIEPLPDISTEPTPFELPPGIEPGEQTKPKA